MSQTRSWPSPFHLEGGREEGWEGRSGKKGRGGGRKVREGGCEGGKDRMKEGERTGDLISGSPN